MVDATRNVKIAKALSDAYVSKATDSWLMAKRVKPTSHLGKLFWSKELIRGLISIPIPISKELDTR